MSMTLFQYVCMRGSSTRCVLKCFAPGCNASKDPGYYSRKPLSQLNWCSVQVSEKFKIGFLETSTNEAFMCEYASVHPLFAIETQSDLYLSKPRVGGLQPGVYHGCVFVPLSALQAN